MLLSESDSAHGRAVAVENSTHIIRPSYKSKQAASDRRAPLQVLKKSYGSECDIWSCGVMLYILLCGVPPFFGDTESAIFRSVIKGQLDFESAPWPRISAEAKDCVRRMIERDVNKRATADQILKVRCCP